MIISFQGVKGAYSHQAISEIYPDAEVLPCRSFEGSFDAVHEKRADLAVIPIENSTYGRVADVHYLLPNAGLSIIGEHFLRIRINWLARDGQSRDKITQVISHPVLLGQCRKFMIENDLEWQNFSDTAAAAREVAQSDDPEISALSSPFAGEIYNLKPLAENVEDHDTNTTRFLILSPSSEWAEPDGSDGNVMTSFVFDVRNIPAALYKALGGFATNGVNMTKLESYMIGGKFSATQFYAEVEGHPSDPALNRALEELEYFTTEVKILGVFKMSQYRKTNAENGA